MEGINSYKGLDMVLHNLKSTVNNIKLNENDSTKKVASVNLTDTLTLSYTPKTTNQLGSLDVIDNKDNKTLYHTSFSKYSALPGSLSQVSREIQQYQQNQNLK